MDRVSLLGGRVASKVKQRVESRVEKVKSRIVNSVLVRRHNSNSLLKVFLFVSLTCNAIYYPRFGIIAYSFLKAAPPS